jgi:D-ribose pyranase
MRKTGKLLNPFILEAIASLGHGDTLVIADAGLPMPEGVAVIDVSLLPGVPSFIQTLSAVLDEMQVESVILAEETAQRSLQLHQAILALLGDLPVRTMSHETFKVLSAEARVAIRTGECTPYANIILVAGVTF